MPLQIQIIIIKHYLITYYFNSTHFTLYFHFKTLPSDFLTQDVIWCFLNLLSPFNNVIFMIMRFINFKIVSLFNVQMFLLSLSKPLPFSLNYPKSNFPLLMILLSLVKALQFLVLLILFLILNPTLIYEVIIILKQVLFPSFNTIQMFSNVLALFTLYFFFLPQIGFLNLLRIVNDLPQVKLSIILSIRSLFLIP